VSTLSFLWSSALQICTSFMLLYTAHIVCCCVCDTGAHPQPKAVLEHSVEELLKTYCWAYAEQKTQGSTSLVCFLAVQHGVAQQFGPAGSPRGEHCIYSQPYSCINRHHPSIMRLQAVFIAQLMIIWVDHTAHCGHAHIALSNSFTD